MTTDEEYERLRAEVFGLTVDFHRIVNEAARGMTAETLGKVAPLFERAAMLVVAEARAEVRADVLARYYPDRYRGDSIEVMIDDKRAAEALVAEVRAKGEAQG